MKYKNRWKKSTMWSSAGYRCHHYGAPVSTHEPGQNTPLGKGLSHSAVVQTHTEQARQTNTKKKKKKNRKLNLNRKIWPF